MDNEEQTYELALTRDQLSLLRALLLAQMRTVMERSEIEVLDRLFQIFDHYDIWYDVDNLLLMCDAEKEG